MKNILRYIINRGIKEGDDMEMRRRIGLLNMASFLCFVTLSIFMTLNIIQHKWVLLISNAVLLVLTISLLFISRLKYFGASIVMLSFLFTLYFFFTALLFRNGLEFAIIIMMAVSVLLVNNRPARVCILVSQVALFGMFMYFQKTPAIIPPLPAFRNYLIIILLLLIFACMLEYFKSKQLQYIKSLNKANEELRESNRVKERMLSILSHDFNAPVGSLATTLNLFDEGILTEGEFRDVSTKLKAQLQVLTISLADVLHWSKMQIAGDTGQPGEVNIKELLLGILPLFQHTLQDKNITLQICAGGNIVAFANADHLKLIFRNLLSNAIKFSHKGSNIYITTAAADGKITVSLTDEGTGMQPNVLEALQKDQLRFTSTPGTAKEKGTGLGLMLVREFLYNNGGELSIQSAQGKGSTFSVTLPATGN
jgi:signal transduction histidine kinase